MVTTETTGPKYDEFLHDHDEEDGTGRSPLTVAPPVTVNTVRFSCRQGGRGSCGNKRIETETIRSWLSQNAGAVRHRRCSEG